MKILALSWRSVMRWPLPARMAYQSAVLRDPAPFGGGGGRPVSTGAVLLEAHRFLSGWERGVPWNAPRPEAPPPAARRPPPDQSVRLARTAASVGVRLARIIRIEDARRRRTN